MNLEEIIYLEKLHRKVFDTFYVQNYEITVEDEIVISEYKALCEKYPGWRQILKSEFPKDTKYKRYSR
jgi:hypothetical protein